MTPLKLLLTAATLTTLACTSGSSGKSSGESDALQKPAPGGVTVDPQLGTKLGITVAPAALSTAGKTILSTGQLQVNEDATWMVGAITDGKIIGAPVTIGDHVKEGQILATLHSHDVHDAQASYRQAVAELQRQKTLAEQALTVRDRTKRLFELRAASREQLEAAETMLRSTDASVRSAEAEVEKVEFHLTDFLEVPVESQGHESHESAKGALTIKSPATGTLMERKVTPGSVVSAGDPVFTVSDLTRLWMIAAVNEADMGQIRPGQSVQISVRAFTERKFTGRVLRLGERLDSQTRTLQVRVLVPNEHGLLKPGMFANAEFPARETKSVIQISESSVQDLNGKTVVFIQGRDGSYNARAVTLGERGDGTVEIVSGIEEGESVVIKGGFLLKSQMLKGSGD